MVSLSLGMAQPELSEATFTQISRLVKNSCGINLHSGKVELVKARLGRRLRELGLTSYRAYLDYLRNDASGREFDCMLNALSTNVTNFFREPGHFNYLSKKIFLPLRNQGPVWGRRLRLWSAGCATGEEPYTLAMVLLETLGNLAGWDAKILATDLSSPALAEARCGIYDQERMASVAPRYRERFFDIQQHDRAVGYSANRRLRSLVFFARLNLMENWPMQGPFDVIFCRNVMIYFEREVRQQLVSRFWKMLRPGGHLFIGHSESFSNLEHRFVYREPTIYQKV